MLTKELLIPILGNDALTRGLGDAEARMLVEWLVEEADRRAEQVEDAEGEVRRLCRWARAISRFVHLWCYVESPAAAYQLAASENFAWTLPAVWTEPCELMEYILGAQPV